MSQSITRAFGKALVDATGGVEYFPTNLLVDYPNAVTQAITNAILQLYSAPVLTKLAVSNPSDVALVPFFGIGGTDASGNTLGLIPQPGTSPTVYADVPSVANLATDGTWTWQIPSTATDGSSAKMLSVQLRNLAVAIAAFMIKTPNASSYVESITLYDQSFTAPEMTVFLDEPVYMPNFPYQFVVLPYTYLRAQNEIINIAFTFRNGAAGQSVEIVPLPQVAATSKGNSRYIRPVLITQQTVASNAIASALSQAGIAVPTS